MIFVFLPLSWQVFTGVSQLFTCWFFRWSFLLWTSSFTLKLCCQPSTTWTAPCRHTSLPPATETPKKRWRPDRAEQVSPNCLHTGVLVSPVCCSVYLTGSVPSLSAVSKGAKDGGVFSFKLFAMLGCFHVEVCDDRRSIADIRVQGMKTRFNTNWDLKAQLRLIKHVTWLSPPCRHRCIGVGAGEGDGDVCSTQRHRGHRRQPQNHPQKGL